MLLIQITTRVVKIKIFSVLAGKLGSKTPLGSLLKFYLHKIFEATKKVCKM